jgi:phage antirepressor YoqD-like protein
MELVLSSNNGVKTMTSLQLVEYINYLRKEEDPWDYTELRHDDFMRKVPKVLKTAPLNFGTVQYEIGQGAKREQKVAIFERREALLMAMSYSYDVQAAVFDAWETAEKALQQISTISMPNFMNPAEAAKAWALEYEQKEAAKLQLTLAQDIIEASLPKVEAFDAFMDKGENKDPDEAARLIGIGRNTLYAIMRMKGFLTKKNLPMQAYMPSGQNLLATKELPSYTDGYGVVHEKFSLMFTPKGIAYFTNLKVEWKKAGLL